MAFVGVLPEQPNFKQLLGRGLGQGLTQGMNVGSQLVAQSALKRLESQGAMNFYKQIMGQGTAQPKVSDQLLPSAQASGEAGTSQLQDNSLQGTDLLKQQANALIMSGNDSLQKIGVKLYDDAISQEKQDRKEAFEQKKDERSILSIEPKKFMESIAGYREKSPDIERALQAEMNAIMEGDVDPFSGGHIAELIRQFDLPSAVAAPFETVGSKEFRTGQKTFLAQTFKDAFRGATTTGQIELASSLLAESGASREGNLASVFLLQSQHLIEKERVRLTDEALEEGVPVYKLPRFVDRKLEKYTKSINDQYFETIKYLRSGGLYEE